MLELIDRAAVKGRRGHDVIAWLEHREERRRLRGDAARKRDGAASPFEVGDALFEDRHRRVHDARIGVAVFLQIEVRRRRLGILEHVTGGLKNRYGARTGVRIRTLSGVHLSRLKSELAGLFHVSLLRCAPSEKALNDRCLTTLLEEEAVVSIWCVNHLQFDVLAGSAQRRIELF